MDYQVSFAPRAQHDFRNIVRYISLDSSPVAMHFATLLHSKTKILQTHPEIGRIVPEIRNVAIREIIVKPKNMNENKKFDAIYLA